ncbi:MAG: AMP-binding protein [Bacteroidota bacterium]
MNQKLPLHLPQMLAESIALYRDNIALAEVGGKSFTYEQIGSLTIATRNLLAAQGVRPGDRVGILSENRVQWGIAFFAILSQGAVAVPILADFTPMDIQNIARHSGCSTMFVSSKLRQKIDGAQIPDLRTIIPIESITDLESGKEGFAADLLTPPPSVTHESLAAIVYTSGTTGFSKGVMLSHRNFIAEATGVTDMVNIAAGDRLLSILPLAHTYECTLGLITPLHVGATVYYLDRPPSAGVLLPAMALVKPTVILSVPLIIEKIYKSKIQPQLAKLALRPILKTPFLKTLVILLIGRKLKHTFGGELRLFCIGGAPLAADVEQFLRDAHFPYAIGYGLTETAPLSFGDDPKATRFRATGRKLRGVEIRIDNPDKTTGEGEILLRGPNVMMGYYRDPERTAEVLDQDGWLRTGDSGVLDNDGYLYIKGRLKSMILGPSGKNIYPEEIESAINEFDLVLESLVLEEQNRLIARAHLNYEELKKRFSLHNKSDHQVREHVAALLEDIRKQVNEKLAHFSRIHRIIDQPEPFEKTPTQKIKRHLYQSAVPRLTEKK